MFKTKGITPFLVGLLSLGLVTTIEPTKEVSAQTDSFLYWPVPSDHNVACGWGCYTGHVGTDIGVSTDNNTPIHAAASGKIIKVVNDQPFGVDRVTSPANGNHIVIQHDNINGSTYYTYYLHLTKDIKVNVNDQVNAGQLLGYGSNSGLTCGFDDNVKTGAGDCVKINKDFKGAYWHLHFQVNKGCTENKCALDPYANNLWIKNTDGSIANPPANSAISPILQLLLSN